MTELNIVRDCWWAMPSGTRYMADENGQLSSDNHSLYKSFNANDSEYVRASDSGEIRYFGRLESSNLNVTAIEATIRAECDPIGIATLYINDLYVGQVPVSGKDDYSDTFILTDTQKEQIYNGRILDNYDYFETRVFSGTTEDAKLYNIDISYSGDSTWDNHESALPNVISSYYYPTSISFRGGSNWTGSVSGVAMPIVASGVDSEYITQVNVADSGASWYGDLMPSGGLSLYFNDFSSSIETDIIYDDYGLYHGSGVLIDSDSFTDTFANGINTGYELVLDGTQYVNMGSGCGVMGTDDLTVMTWFKYSSYPSVQKSIIGKWNAAKTNRYLLGMAGTAYARLTCRFSTVELIDDSLAGKIVLNNNRWHHLAGVFDRDGDMTLYVDGEERNSTSIAAYSAENISDSTIDFQWGGSISDGPLASQVADGRVYRAALTAVDIANVASGIIIDTEPESRWSLTRQQSEEMDPLTQVTRGKLNLRMSLPPSGENSRDAYEVNLYNSTYQTQTGNEYGYFAYGAGSIVEQSGFMNYSTELNFLDPTLPSGNLSSIKNRNIDIFTNSEMQLVGLPSGVQLSSAELYLETIPNETITLYTIGHTSSGNSIDLYTSGPDSLTDSMDLYIRAGDNVSAFLFIEGYDPPKASGDLDLYMLASSGNTSMFASTKLYTKGIDQSYILPLYIGTDPGEETSSMNLFITTDWTVNNSGNMVPLTIFGPSGIYGLLPYGNDILTLNSGEYIYLVDGSILALSATYSPPNVTNLYINAPGESENYIPANADMSLFMARDSEKIVNNVPLYMAQNQNIDDISTYVYGHDTEYTIPSPFTTDNGLKDFANSYDTTINVVKDIDDVKSNVVPDSYGGASWSSDILERQYSATNLPQIELKDRTVCFWYKTPSDIPTTQTLTTSRVGNVAGTFIVSLDVDQQIVYANCPTSTLDGYASGDLSLVDDGGWHHYALMLDRDDDAKLFIDGIKTPHSVSVSGDQATSMSFNPTTSNLRNKFYIGNDNLLIASTSGNFYDYRIYDQPITNSEIVDIKNDTYGRHQPLVHYLPNHTESLNFYIYGSGDPITNQLEFYTHGY